MLAPITIKYAVAPKRPSLAASQVSDLFGLLPQAEELVIADHLELDLHREELVLFVGPSGSGKSSLLRAVGQQLEAIDAANLPLPEVPLVEALTGSVEERLNWLSAAGLGEARLMLRTPQELSEGQRYRFRLAYALSLPGTAPLMLDEFGAVLDRTLAKVVAFNLRKLVSRTRRGVLCATTHEDLHDDLNPDVLVRCLGDGQVEVSREVVKKKVISFAGELWLSDGTRADWPYFARWHYRSHHLAIVQKVILLWHGAEPIGLCLFGSPAASLRLRSQYFQLQNSRSRLGLSALNEQLWLLQRVVLHPTYRGVGLAAAFVRTCCELCPVPWIETLSAMGHANPFFERAGFVRVGVVKHQAKYSSGAFARRNAKISRETRQESKHSEPVYYVFDNRAAFATASPKGDAGPIPNPRTS